MMRLYISTWTLNDHLPAFAQYPVRHKPLQIHADKRSQNIGISFLFQHSTEITAH